MESPIYFLVVQKNTWAQTTQPGCFTGVKMLSVSVWHVLSMPPWDLNLVQIPGKMPPNVKPKVIHYFMSKEKNFTLNQPWRLSWHLETPSLPSPSSHMDSFTTLRLMCCHVKTKKVLKTDGCLHDSTYSENESIGSYQSENIWTVFLCLMLSLWCWWAQTDPPFSEWTLPFVPLPLRLHGPLLLR